MKSVYCAVRTGSLNTAVCASYLTYTGVSSATNRPVVVYGQNYLVSLTIRGFKNRGLRGISGPKGKEERGWTALNKAVRHDF